MTQDLIFCPSEVVMGNFIKTSITCSHTGGIDEGSGGEMNAGILGGGRAGGGGGVEASGGVVEAKGVSGDTRPLGVVDMMVGRSEGVRPGQEVPKKGFFLLGLGLER